MSSRTVSEDTEWSECAGLLYHDFASFAARCFRELNPRARLAMNWHVEIMAGKLAAVREGRIRRLMICVPPRHLKSHVGSVCFPASCLGHDPSAQIVCASYAQDLADKLSRDCRRIVASDWYRKLFPTTRLSPQRQASDDWINLLLLTVANSRERPLDAKHPPLITGQRPEGQIRLLLSNPLRLGMQPSLTLYWL